MKFLENFWFSLAFFFLSLGVWALISTLLYTEKIKINKIWYLVYFLSLIYPVMLWIKVFFGKVWLFSALDSDFGLIQLVLTNLFLTLLSLAIFSKIAWFGWSKNIRYFVKPFSVSSRNLFFIFLFLAFSLSFYSLERILNKDLEKYQAITTKIKPINQNPEIVTDTCFILSSGSSLCGSLNFSIEEAKHYAKTFKRKNYWSQGKFYVLVYPGEKFIKIGNYWLPLLENKTESSSK